VFLPCFVELLEDGVLAFRWTGKHRRVRFADLMQYKEVRDRAPNKSRVADNSGKTPN